MDSINMDLTLAGHAISGPLCSKEFFISFNDVVVEIVQHMLIPTAFTAIKLFAFERVWYWYTAKLGFSKIRHYLNRLQKRIDSRKCRSAVRARLQNQPVDETRLQTLQIYTTEEILRNALHEILDDISPHTTHEELAMATLSMAALKVNANGYLVADSEEAAYEVEALKNLETTVKELAKNTAAQEIVAFTTATIYLLGIIKW